jgi:predicted DNA-binding protein
MTQPPSRRRGRPELPPEERKAPQRFNLSLSKEHKAKLKMLAEREGKTMTGIIERWIENAD